LFLLGMERLFEEAAYEFDVNVIEVGVVP